MYKRDVGVLLVSVIGIYFALSQEGALEMRPAWYHPATREESQVDVAEERPRPRVSDLNGDGAAEVIVAAWDGSLQLLDVRVRPPASRSFAAARLLAEVSAPKHRHADGTASEATPVAFSVGYLDPMPMEKVWKKRKQVVAVVGSDGKLRTYDHNLRLRWEIALEREMPRHTRIEQAALRITRHANEAGDRGTVIVGWSLELGDVDADDPVRSERRFQEEWERRKQSADGQDELEENDALMRSSRVDLSRHFNYMALEGDTGEKRWEHRGSDFHRRIEQGEGNTVPLHNYRLDAHLLQGRHYGEASCREYKESVLKSLPHRWISRRDTNLGLARFEKQRMSSKRSASTRSSRSSGAQEADPNLVTKAIGKAADTVAQGKRGTSRQNKRPAPNTLVAHVRDGLEAIHLYSGRPICMLHLPSPGLHLDLDGDGVLDHVQVYDYRGGVTNAGGNHARGEKCSMVVTSGVGVKELLFNGTICRRGGFQPEMLSSKYIGSPKNVAEVLVAPPAAIPHRNPMGQHIDGTWYKVYDLVFLNSRGDVTMYGPSGQRKWFRQAYVTWKESLDIGGKPEEVPTLRPMALRRGHLAETIVVAGSQSGSIMSRAGDKMASFNFPSPPVQPLEVLDFNADGLNDIILCTADGYYGFVQVRHSGGVPFGALIGMMIVAIVVIWMVQVSQEEDVKMRSTEAL
eukprot:scaffold950_cov360-Pavlova_lutheri.AAC.8